MVEITEKPVIVATIFTESYLFCLQYFLTYVASETHKNLKLLIVANNCKDLVDDLNKIKISIPYEIVYAGEFKNTSETIVVSRKIAIEKAMATKSYLYFLDIDTHPVKTCIDELLAYFDKGKIGMVGGNYRFKTADASAPNIAHPVVRCGPNPWNVSETPWTDKALGLGFGFTIIHPDALEHLKISTDYGKYGTEDYPCCDRVREAGFKIIWVRDIRAKHIWWNKTLRRIEAF